MFTYLFAIFCFGLVITGLVFLGMLEAAEQSKKIEIFEERTRDVNDKHSFLLSARNADKTMAAIRSIK